jgi:hypothetical protein
MKQRLREIDGSIRTPGQADPAEKDVNRLLEGLEGTNTIASPQGRAPWSRRRAVAKRIRARPTVYMECDPAILLAVLRLPRRPSPRVQVPWLQIETNQKSNRCCRSRRPYLAHDVRRLTATSQPPQPRRGGERTSSLPGPVCPTVRFPPTVIPQLAQLFVSRQT